ncbi:hypothetical protein KM043_015024 [Ampulex compressa]|nr:hypothetical protein KM043_015024 [Ampulex compressa]
MELGGGGGAVCYAPSRLGKLVLRITGFPRVTQQCHQSQHQEDSQHRETRHLYLGFHHPWDRDLWKSWIKREDGATELEKTWTREEAGRGKELGAAGIQDGAGVGDRNKGASVSGSTLTILAARRTMNYGGRLTALEPPWQNKRTAICATGTSGYIESASF